jgi:hypothetical protein
MSGSQEGTGSREIVVTALGGGLAAILGLATGPFAPVTTALFVPGTTRMADLIVSEWSRKSNVVTATALQASGVDPDEFCEILEGDPALMGLAQRIMWVASISGNDHKLRVLGGLLGGVVGTRGDKLDETGLIVAALADIGTPHAAVLDVLTRPAPDDDMYAQKTAEVADVRKEAADRARPGVDPPGGYSIPPYRDADELMTYEPHAWTPAQIEAQLPMPPGFVRACLSVLSRHDLARALSTYGGTQRFKLTDFGHAMLDAMRQAVPAAATADDEQSAPRSDA